MKKRVSILHEATFKEHEYSSVSRKPDQCTVCTVKYITDIPNFIITLKNGIIFSLTNSTNKC